MAARQRNAVLILEARISSDSSELRILGASSTLSSRMPRRLHRLLGVSVCAAATAASLWSPVADICSADLNGDGRPDSWRRYDRQGQLSEVAVDTNFDGRADVQEYYERGALVRRESDRDFNDLVDLVQEFDPATSESTRSVADVNFDGVADLLVLFRDGQPVFSKWAPSDEPAVARTSVLKADTSSRTANDQLAPFQDPFSTDLSVRAVRVLASAGDSVGLSSSGGLPASRPDGNSPLAFSSAISGQDVSRPATISIVPYPPRGPPPHLLS